MYAIACNGGIRKERNPLESIHLDDYKTTLLLSKLSNQLSLEFSRVSSFNFTKFELLFKLLDNRSHTQTNLQKIVKIDNAAITRHLKVLEDEEYIIRERNPLNNREMMVKITPKGRKATLQCKKKINEFNKKLFSNFNEEDIENLLVLLEKMKLNLEDI
ncbi:MarR family transcriptional regulator (plasmid) [Niallia circulans]|uniref:MarR family transcriptional regulator n=1 Tax=Niallia circulans TaxID=1397 RepID=A0A553SQX2_NIACI|nr:MarR family transcriptional regulator [Niallia circulans]